MVEGLTVGRREDAQDAVRKTSTALELLARQGTMEFTRQRIAKGKLFFLDAASDWEGFEFIYLISGVLKVKGEDLTLCAGDYFYHRGLPQRAHFQVEQDVELLLVSSPPSFHLMRDEIREMMGIVSTIGGKDEETEEHCHRLERLSLAIGERLGLGDDRLVTISYAAYLHDIGKVRIRSEILAKPGPLSDAEWEEMRRHPDYGAEMLADKSFLLDAARIVRAHHERYDGKGYPHGLKGEEIPIEARIIAVVDAYDAMISDRPYRNALDSAAACAEIKKNSGTQFDPRVVDGFLRVLGTINVA